MTAEFGRKAVGKRLRALRAAAGLGVRECARRAGIAHPNLSATEGGRLPLSAAMAWRLSRVLGEEVLGLAEAGRLLQALDLSLAVQRVDLGSQEAFTLPGGVVVLVPSTYAKGFVGGPAAATPGRGA